jgi:hypothetical protein
MKSSIFLRIASIITLLYFAGHTSGIPWTPDVGPGAVPVLEAMKSHSFEVIGSNQNLLGLLFRLWRHHQSLRPVASSGAMAARLLGKN